MKTHPKIIIAVFVLTSVLSHAQEKPTTEAIPKRGIGFMVSTISLDQPDDFTFNPKLMLQRWLTPRLAIGLNGGFVSHRDINDIGVRNRRVRITFDGLAKYSIVKINNHHLRIMAGPSLWFRDDLTMARASLGVPRPDGTIVVNEVDYNSNVYWELGYNVGLEAEVSLAKKWALLTNAQFVSFQRSGQSSMLGLGILYKY